MTNNKQPSTRLYVLLARKAPVAVVFRRGPSKQVLLIKWYTDQDIFEEGQWLKGRIYERRCDLSPSGEKLIYFAANFKKPYYTWIAISCPPYLTALALWPVGDTFTGGGMFNHQDEIDFSEELARSTLAEGYELPTWLKFRPPTESQSLSDLAIGAPRLQRDGWELTRKGENWWWKPGSNFTITADPPTVWSHHHPDQPYVLHAILRGYGEQDGPWEIVEHKIAHQDTGEKYILGRSDWADWDPITGDLLYAQDGRLFRQPFRESGPLPSVELIDLRNRQFEKREAPAWALQWR
jgi:hypothetical protein